MLTWAGSPCWNPTGRFLVSSRPGLPQVLGLAEMAYGEKSDRCMIFFFFFCFHRHWLGREGQSCSTQYVSERGEIWIYIYFWSLGSWLFENVGYLSAWGFQTTSSSVIFFFFLWPAPNNHHLSNSLIEIKIIKTYCTLGIYCNLLISEEDDTANYILFITLVFYKVMNRIGL